MGEWSEIGLQAGKNVAEKVDEFIRSEHRDDNLDNFDPNNRKELADGTVIYTWYMKWYPDWYKDQKRFRDLLLTFDDVQAYEDNAWKLVVVGDEGGYDSFDGLYLDRSITFPEPWKENEDQKSSEGTQVKLMEYSPICEDGQRKLISEQVIASCNKRGTAELIAMYLRNGAYEVLLSATGKEERIYELIVA